MMPVSNRGPVPPDLQGAPGLPDVTGFHSFHAIAFVENFSLKDLAAFYPEAKRTYHQLWYPAVAGGNVFLYPSGAVVFHNVGQAGREGEILRLKRALPALSTQVVSEEFSVGERPGARPDIEGEVLMVDQLTFERAGIVALTVAQSAAMEYYETIVESMFERTRRLVEQLERKGTTPLRTRPLHKFIGEAVGTRNEVLSVLHLLDKPDAAWDDPAMDSIYEDLRDEFDLGDRFNALELKLRGVQEALELVLDVSRDRRLVLLEASIVVLIVIELVLSLLRRG